MTTFYSICIKNKINVKTLIAKKKDTIKTKGEESYDGSYEEEVERELTFTLIQQAIVRTFSEVCVF